MRAAPRARPPIVHLEIADPEHQFGEDGRARIEFQTNELPGSTPRVVSERRVLSAVISQGSARFNDLAFKQIHELQCDVEEVSGAAGGIQHTRAG